MRREKSWLNLEEVVIKTLAGKYLCDAKINLLILFVTDKNFCTETADV